MTDPEDPPAEVAPRSPSDVLRLAVAATLLLTVVLGQWLFGDELASFGADLLAGLDAVPTWIVDVVVLGTRVLAVVLVTAGAAYVVRFRRWRLLGTVAVAAAAAIGLEAVLEQFDPASAEAVVPVPDDLGVVTGAILRSAFGIAVVSAILTAAAPWMSRRWRRWGWAFFGVLAVARFAASPISLDTLRAALAGWAAGAVALVLLGGPSRRPTPQAILRGLASVGMPLTELTPASVDARGSTPYFGTAVSGQPLFVKALGQDQRSADLLFRIYRKLGRRDLGDERPFSSLRRAVEHEALLALAVRDLGIRTPRLVAFGSAEPNSFVLAYEAVEGRSLDRVQQDEMSDDLLAAIWEQIRELREHRVAHRDLRLANIFLAADGEIWIIDFGFSELAASDQLLATDVAELLASSTLQVGPERAVALARDALGPEALGPALDRLHPWALAGATRTSLKEQPGRLDELRGLVERTSRAGARNRHRDGVRTRPASG